MLDAIEGHLVTGYADGGDSPDKTLELVPGATDSAAAFLARHGETKARFERVADLVAGFESSYGLELLASVHWIMTHESVASVEDVIQHTHAWSPRKQCFTPRQIGLAVDVLRDKGWTAVPVG